MTLAKAGYEHWEGGRRGVWSRRFVIASASVKASFKSRWTRYLAGLAWTACLALVAVLFLLGQLLVKDSALNQWLQVVSGDFQAFTGILVTWLEQNPEVSVRATYNLIFFYYTTLIAPLSILIIALAAPHLISRDIATNALTVYASRAVNRFDYLLGKFMAIAALLCVTWLGPVVVAWFMGNLLGPNWTFFWHSRMALVHAVGFVLISTVALGGLALGASAISGKEKVAVGIWIGLWLLGGAFVEVGEETQPWLKFFSFSYCIDQIAYSIFSLEQDLVLLKEKLSFLERPINNFMAQTHGDWKDPKLAGAIYGLGTMLAIALGLAVRRSRPQ